MAASVKIFLVRHAKAGDRSKWTKPDDLRPLTAPGRAQAEALVDQLADFKIDRVLSSHYARCVQTVEPLAGARGLTVERDEALVEGASLDDTLALISKLEVPAALCTHGDVLELVVGHLEDAGVPGADARLGKKGSTWVLDVSDGVVTAGTYLEPPA
jgi:broad specificity phosphatase PhoE